MNTQQTRSKCEERKIHINFVIFFFFDVSAFSSAQNALILWMNHSMMSHGTMLRRKDTFVLPPLAIYECEFVLFRLLFYSFFFRFYEEIYTQQWQHNTIFRSSLLRFFFPLPFECSHLFSILVITALQFLYLHTHTQTKQEFYFDFFVNFAISL